MSKIRLEFYFHFLLNIVSSSLSVENCLAMLNHLSPLYYIVFGDGTSVMLTKLYNLLSSLSYRYRCAYTDYQAAVRIDNSLQAAWHGSTRCVSCFNYYIFYLLLQRKQFLPIFYRIKDFIKTFYLFITFKSVLLAVICFHSLR